MRKEYLFLISYAFFIMFCSENLLWGQQGVLLQEKQEHDVICTCGNAHNDTIHIQLSSFQATPPGENGPLLKQTAQTTQVTPRRGSESNSLPDFANVDYIRGPKDVTIIFGAGESSVIDDGKVEWPGSAGSVYENPITGTPSILLGSLWAKNAVVAFADNKGTALGELYDVKFYNNNTGQGTYTPGNAIGEGNNTNGWGGNGQGGPIFTAKNTAYTDKASGSGNEWGRPVRLYAQTLPYVRAKDALFVKDPGFVYATDRQLHDSVWNALVGLIPGTTLTTLDNANAQQSTYRIDGIAGNGTIFSPVQIAKPVSTAYNLYNEFSYYVPIYYHLSPYRIPIETFRFEGSEVNALYTSTKDQTAKDDGEELLVRINGNLPDMSGFATYIADKNYYRPTTLLLSGANVFDSIAVSDVEWYAARLKALPDPFRPHEKLAGSFGYNCAHFSGYFSYQRENNIFDVSYQPSERYVDAAVRILDNADVCVKESVEDKTSDRLTMHVANDQEDVRHTDALLVLPGLNNSEGVRSNFRLKIGGDANMLHTQDSNYYTPAHPLEDGYLYSGRPQNAKGPGARFPRVQRDIFLSGGGTNTYQEVVGLDRDYNHPREVGTLTDKSGTDETLWMPYSSTSASVYGVQGAYNGGTRIHTRSVDGNDTTAIIQIGSLTNNQHNFHIYSGGMLKNFCSFCTSTCDSLLLGGPAGIPAPGFHLSNDNAPLYIINDGNCCESGIRFHRTAVESINDAIAHASGCGDLHIQAHSFVKFLGADLHFVHFAATATPKENEIKILSDQNVIYMEEGLKFERADTAHLTLWAKGPADALRGYSDLSCHSGAVKIDGNITAKYDATKRGKGLILLRSENDDILLGGDFAFENKAAQSGSGELMVQAGQDLRIAGATTLTHDGPRSMLFEAQKTVAFGPLTATMGNAVDANGDKKMKNGDLTIKAGYEGFLPVADVASPFGNWGPGACVAGDYANRNAGQQTHTGGDIWFQDDVAITLAPAIADSVDTYVRAFNSIYIDGDFKHELKSKYTPESDLVDTTLLFAETGNIEAITVHGSDVTFDISANDSTYLLLQAGNQLGNPCGATTLCPLATSTQWRGNILFGKNKTLTIRHDGVGPTLISAARDIESRTGAKAAFIYTNPKLGNKDHLLLTAGRHIETHASYLFDYNDAGPTESNITMQAGHTDCNQGLCKTTETASNPSYNGSGDDNTFASGGVGQGSILLFDSATFNYAGAGTILLTAKNGNIESDPHLHGNYERHDAALTFNHAGTGITRMEAIDIRLHDHLVYNGRTAKDLRNGQFYMAAYDSILTRGLRYNNTRDTGSVFITTDKYKSGCDAAEYAGISGGPGIHQGHIVLGYGADGDTVDDRANKKDSIVFNFSGNTNTIGANVSIRAGYPGFEQNRVTGRKNHGLFANDYAEDQGKGYGGNITFDFILADMAQGDHTNGGYMEISTPNGNIWGKDSMNYHAHDGDLLVDAGLGSLEDTRHAVRWSGFGHAYGNGNENTLNTNISLNCESKSQWRTGNIMMKGATLDFNKGKGNAIFRTREGFIDTYDAFTAQNMEGHLLKYAGADHATVAARNHWGDISERDFRYIPDVNSGSVFFGADDNIMLNYGNSNATEAAYGGRGSYHITAVTEASNPYYSTEYMPNIGHRSLFNVNKNGYMWYRHGAWKRPQHILYRGCTDGGVCSPVAGECKTSDNNARDFVLDFSRSHSGGFAAVARNYIDIFTKFTYYGGGGSGLHAVPGMGNLRGENVQHYGLYMKSRFDGTAPEKRRATCEDCGGSSRYPIQGRQSAPTTEWTYIGFHDDAHIHTQNQKSLIEAPVIEFFGHAELNTFAARGAKTELILRSDSLIFHDSVIFSGTNLKLLPYTVGTQRQNDMRYGVVNDDGPESKHYYRYGSAIRMPDRNTPVIELGYQRCTEPLKAGHAVPNHRSQKGLERVPTAGGDVIVAFRHDFSLPIYNSIVANHARISFISRGGEYVDACIRTDLLRIRNKVAFYTDPARPADRLGTLTMTTADQMSTVKGTGIYPRHLHLEPGSELSLPGEKPLMVISTTTLGGYGHLHEDVFVTANGILAPGYASLMESDCQTSRGQGTMTIHNLTMESDAVLRISIGPNNLCYDDKGVLIGKCTRSDVLVVQDEIRMNGKVPVHILPEMEHIDEGCYLILEYGDTLGGGLSAEYVKNLELVETQFGELNFGLDHSTPGKVFLCVTQFPIPVIQRYIDIPAVNNVTTLPGPGKHYVRGSKDFTFTATFGGAPLRVVARGVYSGKERWLDKDMKILGENSYEYRIRQVVEPWIVSIGPEINHDVRNENADGHRIWSYRNTLYVRAETDEVVSIYNMTGILHRKIELPAGLQKIPLERGIYVVTLKDGSAQKIVIN
jgi:hypothetical protein